MRISDWSSDVCSSDLAVLEILAVLEGVDLDLGLHGGPQAALVQRLGRGIGDRALQHLAHHRGAVALLQQLDGRLARAKARDLHAGADLTTPVLDFLGDRSEERRVGKACVSTGQSPWTPDHEQITKKFEL